MMNNVTAMAKEKVGGATWEGPMQSLSEKLSLKTSKPTRHTGHDGDGDDNDGDGDDSGYLSSSPNLYSSPSSRNYYEVHTGKEQSTSSISWGCKVYSLG